MAAEYVNLGRQLRGYYFESSDKKVAGYFDNDGKCLENLSEKPDGNAKILLVMANGFIGLKQKITNGVDYGASRGTPFWAVADGTVQESAL